MTTTSHNDEQQLTLIQRLNRMERAVDARVLAALLGVSAITIYKLAKKGAIPSFRIATAVRFDPCAIARWLRYSEEVR